MFDPSKLDLNLDKKDNKLEENIQTDSEKKEFIIYDNNTFNDKKTLENNQKNEEKKQDNDDILSEILLSDNETIKKEESKKEDFNDNFILNDTNNPILEKDNTKIKKETTKQELNIIENKQTEKRIIYDINIESLKDILYLLIDNQYDFVILEPNDENIKISFRKDKIIKDIKYIKFPIYSQILVKTKNTTKINIEENKKEQEGTGEILLRNNNYKLIAKTVPSDFGEKIFLKVELIQKKVVAKTKKTSLSQIIGFIGALVIIGLIVGGSFTTYIVLNARTIEDVQFFRSLGINLNDINTFITKIIVIIFSILMFLETIFLILFLFKFILTKKEFKQKKIKYGVLSVLFLIICFSTASLWMYIDKKVKALPNWQEMAYGEVQIYDNLKLKSEFFDKGGSIIQDTSNLIGPVEIKFDLTYFAQKEEQAGFKIKNFIWNFGDKDNIETPNSSIIKNFDEKGVYQVSLIVQEIDLKGDLIEKVVENIPTINISYLVKQNEKKTENGGKIVDFDANDVKQLGKVEWYYIDNLDKPVFEGYTFYIGKAIFEETLVGMYIKNVDKEDKKLDKIFIITGDDKTSLDGEITNIRSIENDLEFELKVENITVDSGNGYIEEYKWIIDGREISKIGNIENPSESSKLIYKFSEYGKHNIKVILKDSSGIVKELTTTIDIPKNLTLSRTLDIYNNDDLIENLKYESKLNEYYIDEIGVPTKLKLDARFVKSSNIIYTLSEVNWDFNSDGDIDDTNKLTNYNIDIEGNHTISVEYIFKHRKIENDIIKVNQKIYVEGIKKDAILNFDINKKDNYVPIIVGFDASKSIVKNENIVKFIWDYGDGVTEERDSIVPGHKYLSPGDYTIKLKVITESGKEYEISKMLILKPKPQSVNITSSMTKTTVGQGIDFSSKDSEGQIVSYLWTFGDGTTSTQANPTHSYKKTGEYKVELQVDFDNNNTLKDIINIEVVNEY